MALLEAIGNAPVVAMIGMCKNAGKTTAMNRLLAELADQGRAAALTSVGRDGETQDLVTGTAKPPIYMRRGMLAATAADLLKFCDVSREILQVTDWSTPLGNVVVFRAVSDGFVQLAGPSIMAHMRALSDELERLGADLVLIDGALSRRSPASGALKGCCVLSTGASYDKDMRKVVDDTAYVYRLLTLPESAAVWEGPRGTFMLETGAGEKLALTERSQLESLLKKTPAAALYLTGALTDTLAKMLMGCGGVREGFRFVVEDSSRILLSRGQYDRLSARGIRIETVFGSTVAAVTINPVSAYGWRFDPVEFRETMAAAVAAPVINVEAADDSTDF